MDCLASSQKLSLKESFAQVLIYNPSIDIFLSNLMNLFKEAWNIIQILTSHEGNGGKLLFQGEIQPWPTIHQGP